MARPIRRIGYSPEEAFEIYIELGKLSIEELRELHHTTESVRQTFFGNIYGFSAGKIAKSIYQKWAKTHRCGKECAVILRRKSHLTRNP